MKTKLLLDKYVKQYEVKDFIKGDPIQFPHGFVQKFDIEIAGFIASMMAYGKRENFINKLNELFSIMENRPYDYVLSYSENNKELSGFNYRFSKDVDFSQVLLILKDLYSQKESLESLFAYSYKSAVSQSSYFQGVIDYFYSRVSLDVTQGFYHLLPNPKNGSAMKRLNMLMRWFVRDGEVDLGIWDFVSKADLFIPLDTHVARLSRELGLLNRNSNDFCSVLELTKELKKFDNEDPVKYDFALFGYGVNN